ncbi:MAG: YqgE/AlgH family protein [Myxococcota bacterium]
MADSFAPGFLVAAPALSCSFFGRTVVLLVDHSAEGSFGFVVNKPSPVRFEQVVEELSLNVAEGAPTVPVLQGGPVSPETGWVVFDPVGAPAVPDDVLSVTEHVALSASLKMLEHITANQAPRRSLLALGYAGWSPGQLESEMKEGSWIPVDLDADVVFDLPTEQRWEAALRSLGIDPARVISRKVAQA